MPESLWPEPDASNFFIKKVLAQVFSCEISKNAFLRKHFLQNTSRRLLRTLSYYCYSFEFKFFKKQFRLTDWKCKKYKPKVDVLVISVKKFVRQFIPWWSVPNLRFYCFISEWPWPVRLQSYVDRAS